MMRADVVFCYSRVDQWRVMSLVERLQGAGVSVWIDYGGIDGASLWGQEIVEAIKACKVLILMVSKAAVASDHVVTEVTLARESKKSILPLFLEPVDIPTSITYQLAGIHRIELFRGDEDSQFKAIVRSLSRRGVGINAAGTSSQPSSAGPEGHGNEGDIGGPKPRPDHPTSKDPSTSRSASRLEIDTDRSKAGSRTRSKSPVIVVAVLIGAVGLLLGFWLIRRRLMRSPPLPPPPIRTRLQFDFSTPTLDSNGKRKGLEVKTANGYTQDLGNGLKLEMVKIPPGEFMMGSSDADVHRAYQELKRYSDRAELKYFVRETPQHPVLIKYSLYVGRFEVTQAQWRAILGNNPAAFDPCDECPVQQVSWDDAVSFCSKLSERTGDTYRLPTEAEWEYAARAGTTTPFAFGDTLTPEIVNYNGAFPYAGATAGVYRQQPVRVGSLGVANAFGLSDVHGSVREWCEDWYHDSYKTIAGDAPNDGSAWLTGGEQKNRVLRGGSWFSRAVDARSADRHWPDQPNIRNSTFGLRVVVTAEK